MEKIHLLMPMGGAGSRFSKNGYQLPKPLLKIKNLPFFYWATKSITKYVEVADITFVVLQEHIDKFEIDKEIINYFPDAKIVILPEVLNGAVLTCMEGVRNINDSFPIIFNDCDHIFKCTGFYDFCNKGDFSKYEGALLTFLSNDPKFSFLRLENNRVVGTVEKQVVSNNAICGAYYFKNKSIFLAAAAEYLNKCSYAEYFVSGVYNIMADKDYNIASFVVDYHLPFGTPEEYDLAINSNKFEDLK